MECDHKRRPVTNRQRSFLGNNLGNSWRDLARDGFEFKQADIDQILGKHPGNVKRQAREALDMWCQRLGQDATVGNIELHLVSIGRTDIFEQLRTNGTLTEVLFNQLLILVSYTLLVSDVEEPTAVTERLFDSGSSDECAGTVYKAVILIIRIMTLTC